MKNDILNFLAELLKKKHDLPKGIDLATYRYIDSGHIDSISMIGFIVDIESYFDIEISDLDMESSEFRTIGGLINIINRKITKT